MIALRRDLGVPVDEYGNIVNLRLTRTGLSPAVFPATAGFFAQPFMAAVAAAYFAPDAYRLNGEIFVTDLAETVGPQTAPPFALHFDKRQVLKFFVYLTATADWSDRAVRRHAAAWALWGLTASGPVQGTVIDDTGMLKQGKL